MAPLGKKRKRDDRYGPVEELTFDPEARQEYLTGFSKRKQARKDHAREVAIKREKEEKIQERKAIREQKRQEVEEHVEAVNKELRKQNALIHEDESESAEDGFDGFDQDEAPAAAVEDELPSDEEYVDEEKYTSVTVEPMDMTEEDEVNGAKPGADTPTVQLEVPAKKKRPWQKDGEDKEKAKTKKKKKKFRYESKAERAVNRQKQKSKNSKAASARKKAK